MTEIGYAAFYSCDSLSSVTIPNSVTTIGEMAFFMCDALANIKYCGTEDEWNNISKGLFGDMNNSSYTITYNYSEE